MQSCADIGRELNCTRANISQTVKRALVKLYKNLQKQKVSTGPFETFETLVHFFELKDQDDINTLYKQFPVWIQKEIKNEITNM